jgi:hypothetical protein
MKRSLSIFTLALTAFSTFAPVAPVAEAGHPRPIHRYRSTYREFDGGFHHIYGYSERECRETYNGYWTSTTCFDRIQPTDYVYVQEQITEDGHSRVQVYRGENDKSPFVEYYVYHERVEHRHYYSHGYIHDDYYTVGYTTTEWAINWDSGWGKIVGGFEVGAIGTSVLVNSASNDTGSKVVGGLLLGSGIASSISGAKQLHDEKTALQAEIAAQTTAADASGSDVE